MREVDLLLVLVPFIEREIRNPAEFEAVLLHEAQLVADPVARLARELIEAAGITRRKEDRIALLQPELAGDRVASFGADILGYGASGLTLAVEDIG
jgi:hypothetical protein